MRSDILDGARTDVGDELKIERVGDLASVREDWTRLAAQTGNVFGTWEWAEAWCRHLAVDVELAIGVARIAGGEAIAILPLCVTRHRPVRVARFVGAGPADELGPLCAPSDRDLVVLALRHYVDEVLDGSGIFLAERLWGEDRARRLGGTRLLRTASPVLPTNGLGFDEFMASRSRNFRSTLRRRERALIRRWRLDYRLTADPELLEDDMRTLIRLHRARWSRDESSVFSDGGETFHLDFARHALEQGWLRLLTMELDGRPVASWYGLRYAGVESYYQAGRDPEFNEWSVGFLLLCHSVRCAFEDGMREYRFGSGNEPYKWRLAEEDPGLHTVATAAGPRARAALAAMRVGTRAPKSIQRLARRLVIDPRPST